MLPSIPMLVVVKIDERFKVSHKEAWNHADSLEGFPPDGIALAAVGIEPWFVDPRLVPLPGQGHRVPFGPGPENGLCVASHEKHAAAGYQVLDTKGPGD